jgi:hypothetical protein
MRKIIEFSVWCVVALLLVIIGGRAEALDSFSPVPGLLHYQAQLTSPEGINVDGEVAIQVLIYDSATLGVHGDPADEHVVYAEDQGQVRADRGTLRFTIGQGTALGPFSGAPLPLEAITTAADLYVELIVDGETVAPRQRIGFHNAAMRTQYARVAQELDGELKLNANNLPDEMNAGLASKDMLHAGRIPPLPSGKLTGLLSGYRMPSDIPLSRISGGSLGASVLPGFSASSVSDGTFASGRLPATVMPEGNVGFASGLIFHGQTLPLPSGFDVSQCAWLVAYHNSDTSIYIDNTTENVEVYTGTDPNAHSYDRTVTCRLSDNGSDVANCWVDYLVVCKK